MVYSNVKLKHKYLNSHFCLLMGLKNENRKNMNAGPTQTLQ